MCASGADRPGRQRDPVQYQVRRAGQQRLILLAGGLALHAVRDYHGRPRFEATARILIPVGKPAPPLPVRPEATT